MDAIWKKMNKHIFYVLECGDGSYYAGYTNDLEKRVVFIMKEKVQNIHEQDSRSLVFIMKYLKPNEKQCKQNMHLSN